MKGRLWLAVLFCAAVPATGAQAQDRFQLTMEAASTGKYVWRGLVVTDGGVFQPGVTAAYHGFSLNFWSSLDLDNTNRKDFRFTETDYTLDYTFSLARYSFSLGSIVYNFPNTDYRATTEFYLALSAESALNPALTVYRDVDEAGGTYLSLTLERSLKLKFRESSLNLKAGLGFGSPAHNRYYFSHGKAACTDILLGLTLNFPLAGNLTVTPGLYQSFLLDRGIRHNAAAKRDNLFFGLSISSSL